MGKPRAGGAISLDPLTVFYLRRHLAMLADEREALGKSYQESDDQAVTGYLATAYVDDLQDMRCVVCISSVFDVSEAVGRTAAAARFEAAYAAMFDGYRRYLAGSAASSPT